MSSSRSSLFKTPKQVFFNPLNIFDTFNHTKSLLSIYFFRLTSKFYFYRNEPVGELCTFCPDGASCQSATYNEPISIQKWFIQDLDISGGRDALCENGPTDKDCPTDLISRRERRDYDRALQTLGNGERVCPSERLFDAIEDSQLMQDYPWVALTKRDLCKTTLPCKPAESCIGRNQCAEGYQWNKLRCMENRQENVNITNKETGIIELAPRQSCNNTLQCQIQSAGTKCPIAIAEVCQCPKDWELGSQMCLKTCIRNEKQMNQLIEQGGCTLTHLQRALGGQDCAYNKPEDCAQCVELKVCLNDDGSTGAACSKDIDCRGGATCATVGECGCISSVRCIQCTAGTHYRRDGKCEGK